ncbi:MAG: DUF1648 domain-containing protein [Acutalibacteraceae bacterium]
MKKNIISAVLIVIAIGLSVLSWFFLPDVVAVQVGFDGQVTNTMPKIFAVAVPFCISVAGSVMNITGKEEINKKAYALSAVGLAVMVLSLLFNR